MCVSGSAPGLGAWREAEAFDLTPVPTLHGFSYEGEVSDDSKCGGGEKEREIESMSIS